jgi:hypothetical protein
VSEISRKAVPPDVVSTVMSPLDVFMTNVPPAVSTLTTVPVIATLLLPELDVTVRERGEEELAA